MFPILSVFELRFSHSLLSLHGCMAGLAMATHVKTFDSWLKHAMRDGNVREEDEDEAEDQLDQIGGGQTDGWQAGRQKAAGRRAGGRVILSHIAYP